MSKTTFEIDLDGTELPVSSFSYRSDSSGESGSLIVQGVDLLTFISDNQATGTITLNKIVTSFDVDVWADVGVVTEILTSGYNAPNVSKGPVQKSIAITLADIVLSGTAPATFEVDDLTEFEQLQGGFWSFRLSEVEQGYQSGMTVDYLSVERYILSVAVEWNGDTFGSVTLTEGTEPA